MKERWKEEAKEGRGGKEWIKEKGRKPDSA